MTLQQDGSCISVPGLSPARSHSLLSSPSTTGFFLLCLTVPFSLPTPFASLSSLLEFSLPSLKLAPLSSQMPVLSLRSATPASHGEVLRDEVSQQSRPGAPKDPREVRPTHRSCQDPSSLQPGPQHIQFPDAWWDYMSWVISSECFRPGETSRSWIADSRATGH